MLCRYNLCSVIAVLVLCWSTAADAIIIRVELQPDLDEIDAPVFPEHGIKLVLPRGTVITGMDLGNTEEYLPTQTSSREISIKVLDHPRPTNATITLRDGRHVTIRFFLADHRLKAASRVECYEPGTMPISLATAQSDLELGKWMLQAHRVDDPSEIEWSRDGLSLTLNTGFVVHTEDGVLLPVSLRTDSARYPVKELKLLDHRDVPIDATLVYAEHDLLAKHSVVHPDHPVVAAFRIAQPHQIAHGWTLVAVPATDISPARFGIANRRKKSAFQDKIAMAVHALGGASKLDDGAGNQESAWTPLQGVGGRVTLGVSRHLSIEGSLDFTRANTVAFADASWDQDRGELHVQETSGRLLAGGLLHTAGQRWIPYARLALGARFSKHELSMGSRSEAEYRLGALFGFGGGLNVMLGKRATAGLSFAFITPIGGDDTAQGFELGVTIAALWSVRP